MICRQESILNWKERSAVSSYQYEEEEFTTQFTGHTIVRILKRIKPHRKWLLGFLLAVSAISFLDSYFTFLSKRIIDEGILASNKQALMQLIFQYGSMIVLQALCVFTAIYLVSMLGERIQYDFRQDTFNHLQELSLTYYDQTPVGWIISRVTSDAARVADLVTWGILDITWGIMGIVSSVTFMLVINWKLALLVFTIIPLLLIVAGQFKKRIISEYRQVRKVNSKITAAFNENITGVRVVKALRREEKNLSEFKVLSGEMFASSFRAAWLSALFLPVVQLISAFALGIVAL